MDCSSEKILMKILGCRLIGIFPALLRELPDGLELNEAGKIVELAIINARDSFSKGECPSETEPSKAELFGGFGDIMVPPLVLSDREYILKIENGDGRLRCFYVVKL